MAVGLGLLAALLWGAADFLISFAGRTIGVHRSMLYAQGFGAVSVGAWIVFSPNLRTTLVGAPLEAWVAAVGAAPIGLIGTVSLYRGLNVGKVGLVSPVVSAYGAVTALLSILSGEPIRSVGLVGLGATVLGAALVAARSEPKPASDEGETAGSGLPWAAAACLCFGLQFWIQGRFAVPGLGPVIPVDVYYVVATITLAAAALFKRPRLGLSLPEAAAVFGTGVVAVLGFVVVSAGLATGRVAVVTVLSSLQSTVAVGLACAFLHERLSVSRRIGVLLITIGLGLVRLG